jgi:hypothetical protein
MPVCTNTQPPAQVECQAPALFSSYYTRTWLWNCDTVLVFMRQVKMPAEPGLGHATISQKRMPRSRTLNTDLDTLVFLGEFNENSSHIRLLCMVQPGTTVFHMYLTYEIV